MALRGSRKFVRGGPTQKTFFFVEEVREDLNTTISRLSMACLRNDLAFCWRAGDGLTVNMAW